jgi:hypothetical protein
MGNHRRGKDFGGHKKIEGQLSATAVQNFLAREGKAINAENCRKWARERRDEGVNAPHSRNKTKMNGDGSGHNEQAVKCMCLFIAKPPTLPHPTPQSIQKKFTLRYNSSSQKIQKMHAIYKKYKY